jgi:hypothetical protein
MTKTIDAAYVMMTQAGNRTPSTARRRRNWVSSNAVKIAPAAALDTRQVADTEM